MTDIVVTLPVKRGGLFHLHEKSEDPSYWSMKRKPKDFTTDDKVFICTEGVVHGYFEVFEFYQEEDPDDPEYGMWCISFEDGSWEEIVPIPMRGFQSFRYRKFDYKLRW